MEEISPKELLARKTKLVFTATDPLVLDTAFKGIYSGWAAVIAVLKLQFARTVALGSAIGDFATKALTIPVTKVLVHSLEPELHKWIPQVRGTLGSILLRLPVASYCFLLLPVSSARG